eukprot:TRINITY_DN4512_c0_g1_i2.p1 TRINITY_DN4512_c0_g1~~TRINITY_DN4512_c0_g1_i2.p1  ORF type:complete len:641 (+),score=91.82 TRINITY_DN4512_c0_g1_i2:10-1932(+)
MEQVAVEQATSQLCNQFYVQLHGVHSQVESVECDLARNFTVSDLKNCIVASTLYYTAGLTTKGAIESLTFKGVELTSGTLLSSGSLSTTTTTTKPATTTTTTTTHSREENCEPHTPGAVLFAEETRQSPVVINIRPQSIGQHHGELVGRYVMLGMPTRGEFVSAAQEKGEVRSTSAQPREKETWIMRIDPATGLATFQSHWNLYMSAQPDGTVVANRITPRTWESWRIIRSGRSPTEGVEKVILKSTHMSCLSTGNSNSIITTRATEATEFDLHYMVDTLESPKLEDLSQPVTKLPLPSEVDVLLHALSLGQHAPLFAREQITDLRTLHSLGLAGLRALGVPAGHALKIITPEATAPAHAHSGLDCVVVETEDGPMDAKQIAEELVSGKGWVILPRFFSAAMAAQARRVLLAQSMVENEKGEWKAQGEQGAYQRRIKGVFEYAESFDTLATLPIVIEVCKILLGEDFILGAFNGHVLMPGMPVGGEHQDYPYWSANESQRLGILSLGEELSTKLFELQTILAVDEFTSQNGATWMLAGSQRSNQDYWSGKPSKFWTDATQLCCPAGSVILGNGRTWHSSGANKSGRARAALLGQYLRNGTKRMAEYFDTEFSLEQRHMITASPTLRQITSRTTAPHSKFN